jgi:GT2 family glycosyltransferase
VKVPRVRVVVVDHDGRDLTMQCLEHLVATDHPQEALDIVLVDNASRDPVTARVRRDLPEVRVIESDRNLGFAGGCNLGIGDLDGIDHVALVNNDATVPAGWLKPLLETLAMEPGVGAACPKILLADAFRELTISSPTRRLRRGDPRDVGVRVTGVRVGDRRRWRSTRFAAGTWGPEIDADGTDLQWTRGEARVLVPADATETACELRLDAPGPTPVTVVCGDDRATFTVGAEPGWYPVPFAGERVDVVNNVGTHLVADGYAADRGWLERDAGQYERDEDVFAWCGAAVLLRAEYLREVGGFDERLFLYSEDVELAWRGLQRGWRHRLVPASVVRHVHSATSARHARTAVLKERNRLLVLLRHGSPRLVARALLRYLLVTGSYARRDVAAPLLAREPVRSGVLRTRVGALVGFGRLAPAMLASRRRDRAVGFRRVRPAQAGSSPGR